MSLNSKTLEWENKNIWIIGASQGIGKALAIELLDRGCNLFLTSRKIDSESFKLNHSDKLSFYNGDVTNLPHLVATVGHLLIGEVGHLDAQLLHQLEVNVGAVGCWKAGRLQD